MLLNYALKNTYGGKFYVFITNKNFLNNFKKDFFSISH